MKEVRWKRGFLRLWLTLSAIWIVIVVFAGEFIPKLEEYRASSDLLNRATLAVERVEAGIAEGQLVKADGTVAEDEELELDLARARALNEASTRMTEQARSELSQIAYAALLPPVVVLGFGILVS